MGDAAFTALTTARLVLRRFRPQDLDAFIAYRSDPETARYQSWEAPYRPSQARQFLQELEAIDPDTPGEWFQFAVALRHTDRLIGDCGAHIQAEDPRQAEIGFTLAPQHQGYGYATEAVRRLLHYLLIERGKHRVRATCDDRNMSSVAVLERVACAARATSWRAPGPRASGPTTCSMASCIANGPPPPEPPVRHRTQAPRRCVAVPYAPTPSMSLQSRQGSDRLAGRPLWATRWKTSMEVPFMGSTQSAHPPVVRVNDRAQAELRAGEALVFDWTSLAFCCAVAGEISLRPTTLQEAQRSPAYVPLSSGDGPLVVAHRRAYPMLVGRDIEVDCRRRLGIRSFSSSLPPDLGLRTSFGRESGHGPGDRRDDPASGAAPLT